MVIEQEVAKEWRSAASQPPLHAAALACLSPSCTEKTPVPHRSCKQLGQIPFSSLREEKIKAREPTLGGTAAVCNDLALAGLLVGSPRLAPGCVLLDERAQMLSEKFSH